MIDKINVSSSGAILPLWGHLTMSGEILGYNNQLVSLAFREQRPEMLLNISQKHFSQGTVQPKTPQ